MHIEVPRVSFAEIAEPTAASESAALREAVTRVRELQLARCGRLNARLDARALWRVVDLGSEERGTARDVRQTAGNLARAARCACLRVARTIADLAASERVEAPHVAEALQLRCRDRT